MHTLVALVLTAAAAVVIARPPGPMVTTASLDEAVPFSSPTRKYLKDYLLPRYMWPHYFSFEHSPRQPPSHLHHAMPASVWLNQELERLNLMQQRASETFKTVVPLKMPHDPSYIKRMLAPSLYDLRSREQPYYDQQPWLARSLVAEEKQQHTDEEDIINSLIIKPINNEAKKKEFALTPSDEGYFKYDEQDNLSVNETLEEVHKNGYQQGLHEGGGQPVISSQVDLEPPRQIRQNPNLSRTKTLIAENLDKLKIGLAQDFGPTDKSGQIHMLETTAPDPTGSFYGVAVLSAIGAAAVLAIFGFAIGWYTLSKRAKAAADVDYPAYGVTGPTMDSSSGDRKLAHSAHMYHYQHQKQQIIAMERNGMEQGNGSVSDPDSEDENEEGDYTVYECPGFATTGDMEVKNPLFNEEPTPATPGKCEVVKPQPKD